MKKLSILYTCHLETNSRNVIRKKIETNSKNGFLMLVVLKQMSLEIEVFLELAEEWAIASGGLSLAKCFSFCRSKRLLLLLVDRKTVLCNSSLLVCRLFSNSFQLTLGAASCGLHCVTVLCYLLNEKRAR